MKKHIILHVDMDAFFAQVEERENPHFKGRPIVVGADPKEGKGRGVVSTANYEARKYGIHSALPISIAWKLCPEAVFLPVNMELYQQVSRKIMEIIKQYSEVWEITSLDEAYLDISVTKNYQKAENLAKRLKKDILKKEKLTCTIGIGPTKTIAKMATNKAKPDGLLAILSKDIKKFLDTLDIEELPGIGPKTGMRIAQSLSLLSRHYANVPIRIKDLRKFSKRKLMEILGKTGKTIYEKIRGSEQDAVTPQESIKSISKEHTFEKDTRDSEIIFKIFDRIIKDAYQEILSENISFRTITVICRFTGFETHTKSKTLINHNQDFNFLEKETKKLLLRFIIENPKPIRLVGIRISNLNFA